MKKIVFAGILLAVLVLGAGLTLAFRGPGLFHEQMEEVAESGSFADLQDLREETRMPMMYWIQDEEEFAEWQEHHEEMEDLHGERIHGMHGYRGNGYIGRMGCPHR